MFFNGTTFYRGKASTISTIDPNHYDTEDVRKVLENVVREYTQDIEKCCQEIDRLKVVKW